MKKYLIVALSLLILISTSAHAQLPSYLPADGLVGWWPFNGNANDESGNGNHGVVNGAVLAEDRNGSMNACYSFDGADDFIQVQSAVSLNLTNDFTISAFVKINPLAFGTIETMIIVAKNNSITGQGTWHWGISDFLQNDAFVPFYNADPCFCTEDYGGELSAISNSDWNHLTCSYSAANNYLKYFLNGQLVFSDNQFVYQNQITNYPITFGRENVAPLLAFSGQLDDIAIYNRALSSQEIQNLYTGTTPAACLDLPANLQDGLVGYWPFCGNANDESGNGNNGTVNGATLAADRFGNEGSAYSFDGVDDFVNFGTNQNLSANIGSTLTISFWLFDIGYGNPISRYDNLNAANSNFLIACGSSNPIRIAANGTNQLDSYNFIQNSWTHILAQFDGVNGTGSVYINGILDAIGPLNFASFVSTAPLFAGKVNGPLPGHFNGLIDDITIYNRALSPEEVTQLYAVQSTGDPTAGGGNVTTGPLANVPRGISYQAVARDAQGQAIASSPVSVRFTLHQGTPTGTTEYSETHALTTNEIGLFSTYFGSGTAITSAFDSIVWSNTAKFLQVEIDLGNGYVDMGTQQLMSVPFAYRANEAAAAGTIRNNALPVYADNAAALAAGLVAGELYRTATGDLKVVY